MFETDLIGQISYMYLIGFNFDFYFLLYIYKKFLFSLCLIIISSTQT